MTLRDKYRALLGTISQEDSDVWSGNLRTTYYSFLPRSWIRSTGAVSSDANTDVYVLKVPPKATKLTISANDRLSTTTNDKYGGKVNESATNFTVLGGCNVTRITINDVNRFKVIGITIYRALNQNSITFEFSKNSGGGGTKLLTYLLNLIKRGLSQ